MPDSLSLVGSLFGGPNAGLPIKAGLSEFLPASTGVLIAGGSHFSVRRSLRTTAAPPAATAGSWAVSRMQLQLWRSSSTWHQHGDAYGFAAQRSGATSAEAWWRRRTWRMLLGGERLSSRLFSICSSEATELPKRAGRTAGRTAAAIAAAHDGAVAASRAAEG